MIRLYFFAKETDSLMKKGGLRWKIIITLILVVERKASKLRKDIRMRSGPLEELAFRF